jgi:aminoglycoside phosphotransferase (APT) family kinase protein
MPEQVMITEVELSRRVADALSLDKVELIRQPGGGSRGAFTVSAVGGQPFAFLRLDIGPSHPGMDLAGEAELLRRVGDAGFPVPAVLATIDDPAAIVMQLIIGSSAPGDEAVAAELMAHIARLHALDPADLGLTAAPTVTEAIVADLREWDGWSAAFVSQSPLLRLATEVLQRTVPQSDERPCTLHGDVGPGNFMVHEGRLVALLDWELAHVGDVHEDLAWLWVRGVHTEFGDPHVRVRQYEEAAGTRLDPARLRWHVAFTTWKSVLGMRRRLAGSAPDPGLFAVLGATLAYETLLAAALAAVLGVDLELLHEEPDERDSIDARLLDSARAGEPALSADSLRVLSYLATQARQSEWSARRLEEDSRRELTVGAVALDDVVSTGDPALSVPLLRVLGARADRACRAMPFAERWVQRAVARGYGPYVG